MDTSDLAHTALCIKLCELMFHAVVVFSCSDRNVGCIVLVVARLPKGGRDVEGYGSGMAWHTIATYAWTDWEKLRQTWDRIGGARARILGGARARILGGARARILGGARARIFGGARARILGCATARILGVATARILGGAGARILGGARARILGGARARILGGARARILGGARARILTRDLQILKQECCLQHLKRVLRKYYVLTSQFVLVSVAISTATFSNMYM